MKQEKIGQINIQVDELKNVVCECGCKFFQPAIEIKSVPAIISKTGSDEFIAMQTFVCLNCRKQLEMNPKSNLIN